MKLGTKHNLLTAVACLGVAATGYFTYKATRKADIKLEETGALNDSTKERFKETWPLYIPAVVSGVGSVAAILIGHRITSKGITIMASGAALSADMLRKYEAKTRELLGDEKLNDICRAIAEDEANGVVQTVAPPISGAGLFDTFSDKPEEGKDLFFDIYTNKWFRASKEAVRVAEYHLNRNFCLGCSVSLEDFYDFLGYQLDETDRQAYRYLGWGQNYQDDGFLWIDFNHQKEVNLNGEEYTILGYCVAPENLLDEEN